MQRTVNGSRLKIIFISALMSVFLVGIPGLGRSARESKPLPPETASQASPLAFTLTTSRTVTRADGHDRLLSTQQRFQRADGIYKLVQNLSVPDGTPARVQTLFGFIGLGVFQLDEARQRLVFTGPQVDDRPADVEQFLRAHELFTREESVAGISTLVWRKGGRTDGEFVEEHRAPSLGGLLVKRVKVSARGRETVEATAIQMGEPAPSLFSELFSYRVDYTSYERQVQETETNEPATALLMRQLLERMRQVRP